MNSNYDYLFKYILIGDSNVGKSCLLYRYVEGKFKNQHDPTIGIEFGCKNTIIEGVTLKIQIWDTAGHQSFKSITRSYYKASIVAFLVFDVTRRQSFDNIHKWLVELRAHSHQKLMITLIGNKIDMKSKQKYKQIIFNSRVISTQEAESFAKLNQFQYFQTSAVTGVNIHQAFEIQARKILQRINNKQLDPLLENSSWIKCGRKKQQSPLKLRNTKNSSYLKQTSQDKQCKC